MYMHKAKVWAAAALLIGATGAARAGGETYGSMKDDVPMPFSWSGVYMGVSGGVGSGDADLNEHLSTVVPGLPFIVPPDLVSSYDTDGGIGGVHLGMTKQMGSLVVGGELGLNGADITGTSDADCLGIATILSPILDATSTCRSEVTWVATALARLGYAHGPWMVYATSGWAIAGVDHDISVNIPMLSSTTSYAQQDTADGFAFGGGGEVTLNETVSVGLEYLHADLESHGEGLLQDNIVTIGDRDIDLDIFRARLNFRLGG